MHSPSTIIKVSTKRQQGHSLSSRICTGTGAGAAPGPTACRAIFRLHAPATAHVLGEAVLLLAFFCLLYGLWSLLFSWARQIASAAAGEGREAHAQAPAAPLGLQRTGRAHRVHLQPPVAPLVNHPHAACTQRRQWRRQRPRAAVALRPAHPPRHRLLLLQSLQASVSRRGGVDGAGLAPERLGARLQVFPPDDAVRRLLGSRRRGRDRRVTRLHRFLDGVQRAPGASCLELHRGLDHQRRHGDGGANRVRRSW
jgi:hypothetical protein